MSRCHHSWKLYLNKFCLKVFVIVFSIIYSLKLIYDIPGISLNSQPIEERLIYGPDDDRLFEIIRETGTKSKNVSESAIDLSSVIANFTTDSLVSEMAEDCFLLVGVISSAADFGLHQLIRYELGERNSSLSEPQIKMNQHFWWLSQGQCF